MDELVRDKGGVSREEPGGGRRRWSVAQKATIVAESYAAGTRVAEVAARHGVNESLVFTWRRQARASGRAPAVVASEGLQLPAASFVPVRICAGRAADDVPPEPSRPAGGIEIAVADACIRVMAGADAATLAMILAAVRGVG